LKDLFLRILLTIFAVFTAEKSAQAQVTLNRNNIRYFNLLLNRAPFPTCNHLSVNAALLGKVKSSPLRIGLIWTEISSSALSSQLSSLKIQRKKMTANPRRINRRKLAALDLKLAQLKKDIKAFQSAAKKCVVDPTKQTPTATPTATQIPGEFSGDPASLAGYHENLSDAEIRHLLNKVAFGGSDELLQIGRTQGLTALVNALVDGLGGNQEQARIDEESNYWASQFFYIPADGPQDAAHRIWTTDAAQAGELIRMIYSRNPLQEKMLLMLASHFALSFNKIGFSYSDTYHYGIELHWNLLKQHALGNFRDLAAGMFLDPAMNFWLNNKDNQAGSPNQNYARELLELFLLGARDPITGQANYAESSVVAATAFASGYRESRQPDPLNGKDVVAIEYDPDYHDTDAYTIFEGVQGAQINASLTAAGLINQILVSHPGSARYLAERFAGDLLYPGLPENVVASLAATLKNGNYELKPFLKAVLKSSAMFANQSRNSCIKSPLESSIALARKVLKAPLPRGGEQSNSSKWGLYDIAGSASSAGQGLFDPPSVFGWKGACNINRAGGTARGEGWLPAQRLFNRSKSCINLMNMSLGVGVDLLTTLGVSQTTDINTLFDQLAQDLYGAALTTEQRAALAQFMTTEINDSGQHQQITYDLSDDWYVARKIPRLVCLLFDLVETSTR
jgi:hypothetical protein